MTRPLSRWYREYFKWALVGITLLMMLLSACKPAPLPPASTTVVEEATPAVGEAPTPTLAVPEPTPAVEPNKVVLLAPSGSDPENALEIQNVLSELAAQEGLEFETLSELDQIELDPAVRLAVILPPDPGIANLAAANPKVQFLAVGIGDIQPASNISLIGAEGNRPDQQGFLAGYLASVVTPDWRAGVLSRSDTVEGKAAGLGFKNGAVFFCGLCRPAFPPFVQYPITISLPETADQAAQQAAADQLVANAVSTVYLAPGMGDAGLQEYLGNAGINMIGSEPAADPLRSNWIASVRVDQAEAVRQIWPELIAGNGGLEMSAPLVLADVNPDLLSEGRQRLVESILSDLLAGYIDTGVNPETGEPQ